MTYTVDALLMILIGGMGTLSGAMIGAAIYRLLDFYLFKWFGEAAGFMLGAIYVIFVLFVLWHRRHLAASIISDPRGLGPLAKAPEIARRSARHLISPKRRKTVKPGGD